MSAATTLNRLKGKVALVTGASRGIGAAIARRLADEGADVAISYSASADRANALVQELRGKGVKAVAFKPTKLIAHGSPNWCVTQWPSLDSSISSSTMRAFLFWEASMTRPQTSPLWIASRWST